MNWRQKWERWCYHTAQRLLEWSGSTAAGEWFSAQELRRQALEKFCVAERQRLEAERKLRDLYYACRLVDGLLSSSLPSRAQEQLRVALIAARPDLNA